MGKSGGNRKKKPSPPCSSDPPPKMDLDAALFLRRAHELKEEGNRRFQSKDYLAALDQYDQALKLTPRHHSDRAIFHSNRAACLMQMKPVQYDAVVNECGLALDAHPRFGRALFRRARAFEAIGKLELALQDVQLLLQGESNHQDGLELAKRLRVALGNREEAQQDLQGTPSAPAAASFAGTSPAALGASVVRGSPVGGRRPCLPARPLLKKKSVKPEPTVSKAAVPDIMANGGSSPSSLPLDTQESRTVVSITPSKEFEQGKSAISSITVTADHSSGSLTEKVVQRKNISSSKVERPGRPLKLIYGHDIRLAQMPVNCTFNELRELVRKRFPSSKAVLIKYLDADGDLVTITSTKEVRLAEAVARIGAARKKHQVAGSPSSEIDDNANLHTEEGKSRLESRAESPVLESLRLHVVEVSIEQEPVVVEEDILADTGTEDLDGLAGESLLVGDVNLDQKESADNKVSQSGKTGKSEEDELTGKEIEIDEWLLDFAHLFRMHSGIDPDGHIDLHEMGMELCSEALEETVTSEEAQRLFELAACKFQEVAALAFFNWGNVMMCAARKRIPLDNNSNKTELLSKLQEAFDWAQGQYVSAEKKYEEALRVKPDFYEGVLALGQQKFESAKLRWSLAVASQVDFNTWDSSETVTLFGSAEGKMQRAAEMWDKLEERRLKEIKPSVSGKRESSRADALGIGDATHELTEAETLEQFAVMRSQINLFWGNILFEHSQVEFRLGLPSWKHLLDAAVQKFELAGASASDIKTVLKNHISNSSGFDELSESNGKQFEDASEHDNENKIQVIEDWESPDGMDTSSSAVKVEPSACDENQVNLRLEMSECVQ